MARMRDVNISGAEIVRKTGKALGDARLEILDKLHVILSAFGFAVESLNIRTEIDHKPDHLPRATIHISITLWWDLFQGVDEDKRE